MKIEIKHRHTGSVLWSGEAVDLKAGVVAAVKAKANLGCADLRGAYLGCADLGCAYLGGADLGGADLGCANLGGADLGCANLGGADLRGANLVGAESYVQSHDIFAQLIRNNIIKFTVHEQEMAFRIVGLRLCWGSIRKEYGKKIVPVFKKLEKLGWGEFAAEYKKGE